MSEEENQTGSEEGTEDEEEGEGSSEYETGESVSGSGSSEEGEEESGGEEEDEDEPVLKYKRFAKEVVSSISDPRTSGIMPVHICCITVHPKVGN